MDVITARPQDRPAALRVWHGANLARGITPNAERINRVRAKLDALDAVVLVGREDGEVQAMALAEPWRAGDGTGPAVAGRAHVSMVFVDPAHWGQGLGTALLARLHEVLTDRGWSRTSLWTRRSNQRARALYTRAGYRPTGRTTFLASGEQIIELERRVANQRRADSGA